MCQKCRDFVVANPEFILAVLGNGIVRKDVAQAEQQASKEEPISHNELVEAFKQENDLLRKHNAALQETISHNELVEAFKQENDRLRKHNAALQETIGGLKNELRDVHIAQKFATLLSKRFS